MGDYLVSLIRTATPAAVAVALTWLAVRAGIVLDEDTSAQVSALVTGWLLAVYYGVVRALEARYPAVGWLLGQPSAPTYRNPPSGG